MLEWLPASIASRQVEIVLSHGRFILRGSRGHNYGSLDREPAAQFYLDAAEYLTALVAYVRQMEQEAFDLRTRSREERDRLSDLEAELATAKSVGPSTKEAKPEFGGPQLWQKAAASS